MTRDRNLDQKEIVEAIRIDFDFGSVFEPVDRSAALAEMMHARLQLSAGAVQTQQMRLEDAGDALADIVEITRREHQRLGGKYAVL